MKYPSTFHSYVISVSLSARSHTQLLPPVLLFPLSFPHLLLHHTLPLFTFLSSSPSTLTCTNTLKDRATLAGCRRQRCPKLLLNSSTRTTPLRERHVCTICSTSNTKIEKVSEHANLCHGLFTDSYVTRSPAARSEQRETSTHFWQRTTETITQLTSDCTMTTPTS